MKHWSFELVPGDGDMLLIWVEFKGDVKLFTPGEVSSMMSTKIGEITETFFRKGHVNRVLSSLRTVSTRSSSRGRMPELLQG